jgi:DNA repair exonuclease SbcCD ATPase subunit
MAPMSTTTASSPDSTPGNTEPKQCTTRDLIEQLRVDVTAAKLRQAITSHQVAALEEHLTQLEGYDDKITTAVDGYRTDIEAVCADFADLGTAVDQSKTQFECLLPEDARTKIAQVLDELRHRRQTLEACTWELSQQVLDKECELDHRKGEITREEKHLDLKLARLDLRKTEFADLKDLKESIDCSDKFSNVCRYADYLDLVDRVKIEFPTADEYMCELVEQVEELDTARQRAREIEEDVSVVQDQLTRVTKLYDDLVGSWREELCRAVTAGSVPPLPPDIATVCAPNGKSAGETGTPASGAAQTAEQHQVGEPGSEHEANPAVPPQAQGG